MLPKKLCTILIPAYNMEKYINKAIDSILANKEHEKYINILVVNDGSDDDTVKIVKNYQKVCDNLFLISKSNGNWGSVINYVKNNKIINSEYTLVLDADDTISSSFLKYLINWVDKRKLDIGFFKTKIRYYKKWSVIINPKWFSKKNTLFIPMIIPCSTIFKTSIFYEIDDLIENVCFQDYPMYYKIIQKSKNINLIPCIGGNYWYSRPNNTMTSNWKEKRLKEENILLDELFKINFQHLFIARIMLPGYIYGLTNSHIIMRINIEDYNKIQENSSWKFKKFFNFYFKKAIKRNCVELSTQKTLLYKKTI